MLILHSPPPVAVIAFFDPDVALVFPAVPPLLISVSVSAVASSAFAVASLSSVSVSVVVPVLDSVVVSL